MRPEPLLRFSPFQHTTHVYGIPELMAHIGDLLEQDPVLRDVWVRGEVTNVSRSSAGHYYFSLKEDDSQLRCVLFRGSAFNSPTMPTNGLALVAHGAVRVYPRNATCELVADLLFPEGVGLAQMHGEHLFRRLESVGLFEVGRKRPVPRLPARIGIISSERGAVIHDLLSVLERRYPLAEVIFLPAPVQGGGAAEAMARGIQRLGRWQRQGHGIDVLVLARGGGSEEDLAAFNDERLVRAIFACPVPVVSAVGHETNLTLSDLVADLRAPTPSAAAEILSPDRSTLSADVARLRERARQLVLDRVSNHRRAVEDLRRRLTGLSPEATLSRGYAIVRDDSGRVVRAARTLNAGDGLRIQLQHGQVAARVEAVEPEKG